MFKTIRIGSIDYNLEIANTIDLMRKGLTGRDCINKDSGMLFDFGTQRVQGFWMKETKFNLDLILINKLGIVVSVKKLIALSTKTMVSNVPIRYAIELACGQVKQCGIKVGNRINLENPLKGGG